MGKTDVENKDKVLRTNNERY